MYLKISWTKVRKSFGLPKVYRAGTIIKNFYYHLQRFGKRPTGAPGIGSSETGEKPLQLAAEPFPHRHRLHPPPMRTYEKRIPRSRGILFIGGYRATSFRVPDRSFCRLWRRPWRPVPPSWRSCARHVPVRGRCVGLHGVPSLNSGRPPSKLSPPRAGLREGLSGNRYLRASRR